MQDGSYGNDPVFRPSILAQIYIVVTAVKITIKKKFGQFAISVSINSTKFNQKALEKFHYWKRPNNKTFRGAPTSILGPTRKP